MRSFAFLRGINVGNRRPKKDELVAAVDGPELADTLQWRERELAWTHVGGMLDSSLGAAMPKLIPPTNTVRTAATIERLVAKFS